MGPGAGTRKKNKLSKEFINKTEEQVSTLIQVRKCLRCSEMFEIKSIRQEQFSGGTAHGKMEYLPDLKTSRCWTNHMSRMRTVL